MRRAALAAALGLACEPGGVARPGDPALVQAARDIYATRCATCHGAEGRGDGPAGAALFPRPRDFRDPTWQAGVSDEHLRRVIVEGGAAVGLSAGMLANLDLEDSPVTVGELVAIVRGFSQGHVPADRPPAAAR